jgi:hypothetical protein
MTHRANTHRLLGRSSFGFVMGFEGFCKVMESRLTSALQDSSCLENRSNAEAGLSLFGEAMYSKVAEIMQVLIELRFAPDKISSLCRVPEDRLVSLLSADYSPIEINSRDIQLRVPRRFSQVADLIEQSKLPYSSYSSSSSIQSARRNE